MRMTAMDSFTGAISCYYIMVIDKCAAQHKNVRKHWAVSGGWLRSSAEEREGGNSESWELLHMSGYPAQKAPGIGCPPLLRASWQVSASLL